ncbi:MAG: hypothetical protein LBQ69_04955 [Treponema sp.]|jgi:Mor family transcriptional regulator|nr:hypothetical protein [Treponema sp.]
MAKFHDNALVEDLILACTGEGVSSKTAQRAVRALCRYYGGQMAYIPAKKDGGISAKRLRGILAGAVGDSAAEKILAKIMALYGAMQIYFPLERTSFRKTIALEIYERCDGDKCTMNDLAREYNITAMTAYQLWKMAQREKLKPTMPCLPFLELAEIH